eukprot:gene27739-34506_t
MTSRVRPERKGYDVIIYQQHVDRLKKMAPTVDSGPPREHPLSNKREMDKFPLRDRLHSPVISSSLGISIVDRSTIASVLDRKLPAQDISRHPLS